MGSLHDVERPAATGCRAPLLLALVLLLTVGACCVLGVVTGALISELFGDNLPLAQFPSQREERQVPTYEAGAPPDAGTPSPAVSPAAAAAAMSRDLGQSQRPPIQTPAVPTPVPTGMPTQIAVPTAARSLVEQAPPPSPRRGLPADQPKRPATRLVIPSLGVDAPVVLLTLENGTWDISQLTQEVGHLQGTATPGDPSNVALAGHVTLAQGGDGPFRNLTQLGMGDDVLVYSGDQVYRYVIESVRVVTPEDVEVTFPTTQPILTLITCANWDRARRVYDQRIVAVGHLVQ